MPSKALALVLMVISLESGHSQSEDANLWFNALVNKLYAESVDENLIKLISQIKTAEDYEAVKSVLRNAATSDIVYSSTPYAIRVVGRLGDPNGVELIKGFVESPDYSTRSATYEALAELGGQAALRVLGQKLNGFESKIFAGTVNEQGEAAGLFRCIALVGGDEAEQIYFNAVNKALPQLDADPSRRAAMSNQATQLWQKLQELR